MSERLLNPMVFDFLWEELRLGEYPYPLRVPSHGETMDGRLVLRAEVGKLMIADGVKDRRGVVDPTLEHWLHALATATRSVDAIHSPGTGEEPVLALAASDGETAVLAVQSAAGVRLRPIYPEALVSEVINLLPAGERGTHRAVTLPLDDALRTTPARVTVSASRRDDEPRRGFGLRRWGRSGKSLADRSAGDQREDYALLAAQPRLRGGQLAANSRDEIGRKHRSSVLAWFDTVTGRYLNIARSGEDGHEWITVAPADTKTLRTRLSELLSEVSAVAS
ncbi:ESX secretion-associated protein EspG [Haloechinothrix salitolerans]|uniref:ESX secretion-associated protein EspG n=1 Tax=Haloechinothrix salitolerans TaxID=926830 RepID=A0ABW2BTZ6_9PSEU